MNKRDPSEAVVMILVYTLIPLLLFLMSRVLRRRQNQIKEGVLLEPIARELGREITRDASTPMPFLRLDLQGVRTYFSLWPFGTTSLKVISLVEMRAGCEGFLEVNSVRACRHPSWSARFSSVPLSREHFILTNSPDWAGRVLTAPLIERLVDLERSLKAPLRLQLTISRVTLEAERLLDGPGARRLLEGAARLLDLLKLSATAEGVVILDAEVRTGRCPVCGVRAEPAVACGACHTPHHADCWTYLGRCGIFGCAGRPVSA